MLRTTVLKEYLTELMKVTTNHKILDIIHMALKPLLMDLEAHKNLN